MRALLATAAVAAALAFGSGSTAQATTLWAYNFVGSGDNFSHVPTSINLTGLFATSPVVNGNGSQTITNMVGQQNGSAITSLFPAGNYFPLGSGSGPSLISDNELFATVPHLAFGGVTFQTANGAVQNLYQTGGTYYDLSTPDLIASNAAFLGIPGTLQVTAAKKWDYSYSGSAVVPGGATRSVSGSGSLYTLATPNANGSYEIVWIDGQENGSDTANLMPPENFFPLGSGSGPSLISDNDLFPTPPFLAFGGFTFRLGDGHVNNIYQTGGVYYDLNDTDLVASNAAFLGIPLSFSVRAADVPEPSTLALAVGAVLAFGAVRRRRAAA